ncbi:MAG: hypothetical protein RLZZ324_781 [Candidatus Parcubacteria bacterium]
MQSRRFTAHQAVLAALLVSTVLWPVAGALAATSTSVGAAASMKAEIQSLSQDVNKKRSQLQDLQKKEKQYRDVIAQKNAQSASLADEIGLIENQIAKGQLDIDIAQQEIKSIELEIGLIDQRVAGREADVARQQKLLGALARKLYVTGFRRSALEVLLSHSSLSDYFDELRKLSDVQRGVDDALVRVRQAKAELQSERAGRETKRVAMEEKKTELEAAKSDLEDQRALKDTVLMETKSSELQYRYMLADLKQEQSQADEDIQNLENTLRQKVSIADQLKGQDTVLSWPVPPTRGVATRFHDPDYPFRYVYEHPGLDIRAYQGTPVRAAAAGVVARAKDAGMGYSYVMIIHNGGISTVYGHLSKVLAKEDAFVDRGEVIGMSGGMPGTPGAGTMTTGPHLHFESRVNGIPQDPMKFLTAF